MIAMKKKMILLTFFFLIGLLVLGVTYHFTENRVVFSVAITFGTTFYHFSMRLVVGSLVDAKYHNRMDYTKKWFQEKSFEKKLYKKLKVRKWKKRFPTLNPQDFDLKNRSVEEIIQVTCQAEIVHEIIMVLSFVPVLFTVWLDSFDAFFATSCIAFLFDCVFVIIQRYNRPRLIRLLRK